MGLDSGGDITILDGGGSKRTAEVVVRGDGKNAMAIDGSFSVTIDELLGKDPLPDTYFVVTASGAVSDTVRVQIAATSVDTTTPDRDLVAVDVTTTLTSSEVGDEVALATLIIADLNADTNFINAKLEAQRVGGTLRAIVHITSTEFSLTGEFAERPNALDVAVSATGTTTVSLGAGQSGFDRIKSRGKVVSLARDPDNPHALGILGISGSVSVFPSGIEDIVQELLKESGGSSDMRVDGSSTSVDFTFTNTDPDLVFFITQIRLFGGGNGIKFGQFLSKAGAGGLTNGLLPSVKTSNGFRSLIPIKTTEDFKNLFSSEASNFTIDIQAGSDQFIAILKPELPFPIFNNGSDFVKITVQDDITSGLSQLEGLVAGFGKDM